MAIDEHDFRVIRCRMLGHEVTFAYCRNGGATTTGVNNLPCRKIIDCWFDVFAIQEFLRKHYSDEQLKQMTSSPSPKISSLIDLVQKAQQRNEPDSGSDQ